MKNVEEIQQKLNDATIGLGIMCGTNQFNYESESPITHSDINVDRFKGFIAALEWVLEKKITSLDDEG